MLTTNFNIFLKRVAAYLVDIFIVFLLATAISSIPVFNKYNEQYNELYDSFKIVLEEYVNVTTALNDAYKDKVINQEEYDEIILFEKYQEYFIDVYRDQEISEDDYNKILKKVEKKYMDMSVDFEYQSAKLTIISSIITLACLLGYFGLFQYFFKGKTIGKMLVKIRLVAFKREKLSLISCILRPLIVNNIFLNSLNIIALCLLNKNNYFDVTNFLSFLMSIVEAVIIFLILTREDGRGLHDLLVGTQVVFDNEINDKKTVIDGKYEEKRLIDTVSK